MSSEPTPGTEAGAESLRIDYDLKCHGCGYNLRTMAVDGRCPECNEAVAVTLESLDITSEPEWLGRIRAGLALYPVVTVMGMASALAVYMGPILGGTYVRGDIPHSLYLVLRLVSLVLLSVMPVALGWWYEWLITSPRRVGVGRTSVHRRVLRGVIVAGIVLWIVVQTLPGEWTGETSVYFSGLGTALTVVWAWCLWRWMETIVAPLRRPGLRKNVRFLQWVVPVGLVFQAAIRIGVSSYAQWATPLSFRREALIILLALTGLVTFGMGIWVFATLLVIRYRLAQVESMPAKYLGDVGLAFVLLARGARRVGGWIKRAATYHGPVSDD